MRFLSIEVVLGICAMALIAQECVQFSLPLSWFVVVPLLCWVVYTLDRIHDAKKTKVVPNTGRHQFHAKHSVTLLWFCAGLTVVAVATAAFTFPVLYWFVSIPLAALTGIHLWFQKRSGRVLSVIKDFNVATTFALCGWALSLADAYEGAQLLQSLPTWLPALLATIVIVHVDVLLLSALDYHDDLAAGRPSISVALGSTATKVVSIVLSITSVLIVVAGPVPFSVVVSFVAMSVAYIILAFRPPRDVATARLVIEGVLAIPLVTITMF